MNPENALKLDFSVENLQKKLYGFWHGNWKTSDFEV